MTLISVGFLLLGVGCNAAWISQLVYSTFTPRSWILPVLGGLLLGIGLFVGTRSELRFCTAPSALRRRTWLLGVPIRDRHVRFDAAGSCLVLEFGRAAHGFGGPIWSLWVQRESSIDTLASGGGDHAAVEEVFQIFANSTGLRIETVRR
jgi:hypothetical protein